MNFGIIGILALVWVLVERVEAAVRFEGLARACAGAVPDAVHQFRVRAHGFAPGQRVVWSFEGATSRSKTGAALSAPRLWNGEWFDSTTRAADARGTVELRVLSGQAGEKVALVGRVEPRGEIVARLICDFEQPDSRRRFRDPLADVEGAWYGDSLEDTGYLFDDGLAGGRPFSLGKIYLKHRRRADRGDVDGNWSAVNGHKVRAYIASVSFEKSVLRSDGARVTTLTDPKDTAPYAFIRPQNRIATTSRDGAAQFRYDFGPKARGGSGQWPQITVGIEDITAVAGRGEPNEKYAPTVRAVSPRGAAITWEKAADDLRGKLLLGSRRGPKSVWRLVEFDAKNRRETPVDLGDFNGGGWGIGAPLWAPKGDRFRLSAFGVTNDYSVKHGIFDGERGLLSSLGPLYPNWGQFSPSGARFAFARGSTQVVGSSRIDDPYSLHIWDGAREAKLPVDPSFLAADSAMARVDWAGESRLLVTQAVQSAKPRSRPQVHIDSVTPGAQKSQIWMANAWSPLVSPDGTRVAFWGPESARQKVTGYWMEQPLDQALCVADIDKKPFSGRPRGWESRLPLDRFASYPARFWAPDSRWIFTARADANDGEPFVAVYRYDAQTAMRKRIAVWDYAVSPREKPNDYASFEWKFSGLSGDGKWLFLSFEQNQSEPNRSFLLQTRQWFRLRLHDGQLQRLATFRGTDFAWWNSPAL